MSRARSAQAQLAALHRHHPDDARAIERARREYVFALAQDRVRAIVDAAPPLTESQRASLARLLLAGAQ